MSITIAAVLSILLILIAGSFLLLYWALVYRPHPRIVGRLSLPGLRAPVEVLRDRWGVPHLYAETEQDLWFAQGFVHAQDRLWQMEEARRVAAGRISEGVGEEGLQIDRLARIMGFRRAAAVQVEHLDEDARAVLEAYTSGVNAFLSKYHNRLPMEYALLGLKPEPWTATDTLSIGLLLGWGLNRNWREELARVGFYARLGPERASELLPDYASDNPLILPGEPMVELSQRLLKAYEDMRDYIGIKPPGQGSNAWVVNGSRSISGKPLLANDPHLTVRMPGLWYMAHLEAEQGTRGEPVRLIGVSFPGVPGISLGHNQHIAWGATAACADTADLYVEQQHPQDPTRYRFGDEWEQAQVWEEEIWVKGEDAPAIQRVAITRHGPLITDFLAEHESEYPPLALRWVGHEPGSNLNAVVGIMRAHNWHEFRRAAGELVVPSFSFLYADEEDNIGFIAAGKVPIRARGEGLVPAPGYTGTHEWIGFIPLDELPQGYNPDDGRFITTNNRIVPEEYPHWWGVDHFPGYRARRIAELLEARPKLSMRDFQTMQLDTYNYLALAIAPYFTLTDPQDPWERRIRKALMEWNYRMDEDSMAALAFEILVHHLLQLVFTDKLGPTADDYLGQPRLPELEGIGPFSYQSLQKLVELLGYDESWWFGDGSSGQARNREELLSLVLTRTAQTLKKEIGDDAQRWQYGRLHQILWQHSLGVVWPLRRLMNRGPFPVGGSAQTINSEHLPFFPPLRTVVVAPTYRTVMDPGNWDRSVFVACPGQTGLPGHRFYDNLMHIWLEGDTIPMAFSRQKVEQSDPLYRLLLTPDL